MGIPLLSANFGKGVQGGAYPEPTKNRYQVLNQKKNRSLTAVPWHFCIVYNVCLMNRHLATAPPPAVPDSCHSRWGGGDKEGVKGLKWVPTALCS